MTSDVITVNPEMSLGAVWAKFHEKRITGAPVVDDDGSLIGVISLSDIVREATQDVWAGLPHNIFYVGVPYWDGVGEKDFPDSLRDLRVEHAMNSDIMAVSPDDSVASLARRMRTSHVHRLIVAENGSLKGIVSSLDLVRLLE